VSRTRGAALFALAGAGAAAVHVLTETPGALRDWRQTLPLAALLGALLGWFGFAAPQGRLAGAKRGAALVIGGLAAFTLVFATGHALISGSHGFGPSLGRTAAAVISPTGVAALALGMLAGAFGTAGPTCGRAPDGTAR
jgi:hypothetical protein